MAFSIFRITFVDWISRSRMIICKPIKVRLKPLYDGWAPGCKIRKAELVGFLLFSSVILDSSHNLSGPQLPHVESVEGQGRSGTRAPLSGLSAGILLPRMTFGETEGPVVPESHLLVRERKDLPLREEL